MRLYISSQVRDKFFRRISKDQHFPTLFLLFFKEPKLFKKTTRQDILSFLDSLRKSESIDPLHKWIGTHNTYGIQLMRFFKWLYSPDIEQKKRPKPSVIENIPQLEKRDQSTSQQIYGHKKMTHCF